MFSFQIKNHKNYTEVALNGKLLSLYDGDKLLQEIKSLEIESPKIILDLTQLYHINSEGISLLLKIFTYARNNGGEVVIAGISEALKNLFILTKLNSIFTIFDTKEQAIQDITQLTE